MFVFQTVILVGDIEGDEHRDIGSGNRRRRLERLLHFSVHVTRHFMNVILLSVAAYRQPLSHNFDVKSSFHKTFAARALPKDPNARGAREFFPTSPEFRSVRAHTAGFALLGDAPHFLFAGVFSPPIPSLS